MNVRLKALEAKVSKAIEAAMAKRIEPDVTNLRCLITRTTDQRVEGILTEFGFPTSHEK